MRATGTRSRFHRWVRRGFLIWATLVLAWLANSVRTRGVDESTLQSDEVVVVRADDETLAFIPRNPDRPGVIFICGSGIAAEAYAPLLRPIARTGAPVFIVRLPYRFAPTDDHKTEAMNRARTIMQRNADVSAWIISGHSLGAALAARLARSDSAAIDALVLLGTTHPKDYDLSNLTIPTTKVYASEDGIAPRDRILANRALLPPQTRWIEIVGGNHSQFGRYGRQLFDGKAMITREQQEAIARSAILEAIAVVEAED